MGKRLPAALPTDILSKEVMEQGMFPISLDMWTQARLYSEIELMLCVTTNVFLMKQRNEGRISMDSLTKVIEGWKSKGRVQVAEFQFDQATQRDIVMLNLKHIRFKGRTRRTRQPSTACFMTGRC